MRCWLIILLSLSLSKLYAQSAPDALLKLLNDTHRDDCRTLANSIQSGWNVFSASQQNGILQIVASFQQARIPTYPAIFQFASALQSFQLTHENQLDSWLQVFQQWMATQPSAKNIEAWCEFSSAFIKDAILKRGEGKTWQLDSCTYAYSLEANGPLLKVASCNLLAYNSTDTIYIRNTKGNYNALQNTWNGLGGKVNWNEIGNDSLNVECIVNSYQINTTHSEYTADSAKLFFKTFQQNGMTGQLADKILTVKNSETALFPKFSSYDKHIHFNIASYTSLTAGILLEGQHLRAYGTADAPAQLDIQRFDQLKGVSARATIFDVKLGKEVASADAFVKIIINNDSLWHPDIQMQYKTDTRELLLLRGKGGAAKAPFYDHDHGHEITADLLFWKMDEPDVIIRNLTPNDKIPVYFQSTNFYDAQAMNKYHDPLDFNFLQKLADISAKSQTTLFDADDLAKKISPTYSANIISTTLYQLSEDGFISYDDQQQLVKVLPKTFFYINASDGRADYDIIQMESFTDSVNADLNMKSDNMNLIGVKSIALSDSDFVVLFPKDGNVVLHHGRDIECSGHVFAGWLDLGGSGFTFKYDPFLLDLASVDSLLINLPTGRYDENHHRIVGPIKSTISNVTGTIQIDARTNRSGKVKLAKYPILTTTEPSMVYYNNQYVAHGAYGKDHFYAKLDPFTMDSLNGFRVEKLFWNGTLVTGGMLPDLKERFSIQPDLTIGFGDKKVNVALAGAKGSFNGSLQLNKGGLQGSGTAKIFSSSIRSKNFLWFPDSMKTKADSFRMDPLETKNGGYPWIRSQGNSVAWYPKKDSLLVKIDSVPFSVYNKSTLLKGNLLVQSTGVYSSGTVDWPVASLSSAKIRLNKSEITADSSSFFIKSGAMSKPALRLLNSSADINFEKNEATFQSKKELFPAYFPYIEFKTETNKLNWDMKKNVVNVEANAGSKMHFTSLKPDQDSLQFDGKTAYYDIAKQRLIAKGVSYIPVADAHLIPDSGKVSIDASAKIEFFKAKMIADTVHSTHHFDSLHVTLCGKDCLLGNGRYVYSMNGVNQHIRLDDIRIERDSTDKALHVFAKGKVDSSQKFYLEPKLLYKGKIAVNSAKSYLMADGFAKDDLKDPNVVTGWYSIHASASADSNLIPVHAATRESHRPVTAGIVLPADSSGIYTSLFGQHKSFHDKDLFLAEGITYYNSKTKDFIVGDRPKLLDSAAKGNVLTVNDGNGAIRAEGAVSLGIDYGFVKMFTSGNITKKSSKDDYLFDLMIALQFPFDKDIALKMSKDINEGDYDNKEADYSTDFFNKAIAELIDDKNKKYFDETFNSKQIFATSKALPYTMMLSDVQLKYDKTTKSYYNVKPFTVCFIGENSVAKIVSGYIELGFKRSGDYMNLYIPCGSSDEWFYIYYAGGEMQMIAGDDDFNNALVKVSTEKRNITDQQGNTFIMDSGTENKKNTFINRMKLRGVKK